MSRGNFKFMFWCLYKHLVPLGLVGLTIFAWVKTEKVMLTVVFGIIASFFVIQWLRDQKTKAKLNNKYQIVRAFHEGNGSLHLAAGVLSMAVNFAAIIVWRNLLAIPYGVKWQDGLATIPNETMYYVTGVIGLVATFSFVFVWIGYVGFFCWVRHYWTKQIVRATGDLTINAVTAWIKNELSREINQQDIRRLQILRDRFWAVTGCNLPKLNVLQNKIDSGV